MAKASPTNTESAAAAPTPAAASTEPKMVRLYSKFTTRTLLHHPYKLSPQSFADVAVVIAEQWKKMFPEDVLDAGVAQKELGGTAALLAEANGKIAALEKELAALKAGV